MKRRLVFVVLLLILFVVTACATGGMGKFPVLPREVSGENLAVGPVQGVASPELRRRLLNRLELTRLRRRYGNVIFVSKSELEKMGVADTGYPLGSSQLATLEERLEADFFLSVHVDEFGEEKFISEGTRTLYHYRDRRKETRYQTNYDTFPRHSTADTRAVTREQVYDAEEVPVSRSRLRAVVSVSASLYDLRRREMVWNGNRVEKASGDIERVSMVELTETVLKRISTDLSRALAPGN